MISAQTLRVWRKENRSNSSGSCCAGIRRKMVENSPWRGAQVHCTGLEQFLTAAIAIEHADAVHAVPLRADDVVAAVADHDGARRIGGGLLDRPFQQVVFVHAGAVEFGAEHMFEIGGETEMLDDPGGKDMRLGGSHE